MSYPQVRMIYDDLPLAESVERQVADLAAGGNVPTHVRLHSEMAHGFQPEYGLTVLADLGMKPGTARVLVTW